MHKSRLCSIVIDCENADLRAASRFWSQALGRAPKSAQGDYVGLEDRAGQPWVSIQRVVHPSRVHLDIETDDVDAEVRRLEVLGARRVEQVRRWWVMEAPTGHRFCVAYAKRGSLSDDANVWP
jgi:Glyoxalase-like domain